MKKEILTQEEKLEHKHVSSSCNPAVYVGTYHKYNNGNLSGLWVDLTSFYDYDDFIEFCERLHADEEDPELMFQDFENFPKAWYYEGCINEEIFDKIIEYANEDLDDEEKEAFEEYLEDYPDDTISDFQDKSVGCFYTDAECAEFIAGYDERFNDIPKEFKSCIDYDRLWNSFYRFDYTQYGKYYLSNY